jgi:serine protease Do
MKLKFISVILTAAVTSVCTFLLVTSFRDDYFLVVKDHKLPVNYASYSNNEMLRASPPVDFENAAASSVQAVVNVKTQTRPRTVITPDPFFDDDYFGNLFGQRRYFPPQTGSGSGVVISSDGYIVTNYHVLANADLVTVTFNDRHSLQAEIVGKDASTDIAILKVSNKDLPYMEFGNSDEVKLGQWVLAVGYPFSLDATVTAGIISAKSRAIGINRSQSSSAIESFLQTDAAVNPGNSGGALVNTSGQLIGINSAIASPTGSYAGYSYAIPSNMVKKVANDLIKYGSVQRAYLGIEYLDPRTLSPEAINKLGIDKVNGVYVAGVPEQGAAYEAGIRKGDFITEINGVAIHTEPQMLEQIARYKPGDHIEVTYVRNGTPSRTTVELRNIKGSTSLLKGPQGENIILGIQMRPLNGEEKKKFGINSGLLVTDIGQGIVSGQTNMRKGFVITSVNGKVVNTADEVYQAIGQTSGVQMAGFYPGYRGMYYYSLTLK